MQGDWLRVLFDGFFGGFTGALVAALAAFYLVSKQHQEVERQLEAARSQAEADRTHAIEERRYTAGTASITLLMELAEKIRTISLLDDVDETVFAYRHLVPKLSLAQIMVRPIDHDIWEEYFAVFMADQPEREGYADDDEFRQAWKDFLDALTKGTVDAAMEIGFLFVSSLESAQWPEWNLSYPDH